VHLLFTVKHADMFTYTARQCIARWIAAWSVMHDFVVMLYFKFVYAVFYDIYRVLFLANSEYSFALVVAFGVM